MIQMRSILGLAGVRPRSWLASVNQKQVQKERREFGTGNILCKKQMPPRPQPPDESEFTESFVHGSGPGGQKINKTSSAVQLKHESTGIVLKVQATRSRAQNRKIARELLAAKIEELEKGPESRTAIVTATKSKKKANAMKKTRRKYKALEAAKAAALEESSAKDGNAQDQDNGQGQQQ